MELKLIQQNRITVAILVRTLPTFTIEELIEAFQQRLGKDRSTYVGRGQHIGDYIVDLAERGKIEEVSFGRYQVD